MKNTFKRLIISLLILVLCTSTVFVLNDVKEQRLETMIQKAHIATYVPFDLNIEDLESNYVFVIDPDHNEVIFSHQSQDIMYPASLTKLMTALVVVELYADLDKILEVPSQIFSTLYQENAALAGFEAYEKVSVYDLLHGMLMPSGAEATLTLVLNAVDHEKDFVKLMNEKAQSLGMKDTQFTNTTGLHDSKQYSSAFDMMILLQEVLNNKDIKSILTKKDYRSNASNIHPEGITMNSTVFYPIDNKTKHLKGGKTGFTLEAGLCLASFGSVSNQEFLIVTGQADGDSITSPNHIKDHLHIYQALDTYLKNNTSTR